MKINISLDKKSIENAIKQIKAVQKKVQTDLPRVYLQKCVESIKAIANRNIDMTDIGIEVKIAIKNGWGITPVVGNRITLSNSAEFESGKNLAVFVEFGVGMVGQEQSHTLASQANYEYNVISDAKDQNGKWFYTLREGESRMNIESRYYQADEDNRFGLGFVTKGSPATMFLYKAWKEFETSGLYKTLWEEAKKEVIG
jgi:hypothetical protein